MILLASTSDLLRIITGQAVTVDVHASYMDLDTSAGTVTPGRLNTAITTATTTSVVASPGSGVVRNVKTLHARNTHASLSVDVTVRHTDGTTTSDFFKVTLLAGEALEYTETAGFTVFTPSGLVKTTGITTGSMLVARLASDFASSSVTPAEATGLTVAAPVGTYVFRYMLLYQAAATTTGIRVSCNHSGTVTRFVYNMHFVDNLATASSAAADQDAVAATAQVYSAYAARAKSTAGGMVSISVDTANADMLAVIDGLCVVTADGNLQLYWATEVAASAATIMAGASLTLTRTA